MPAPRQDEATKYLQKRIALFGKAWTIVSLLGIVLHSITIVATADLSDFGGAAIGYQLVHTAAVMPLWLACRTGVRSALFCRAVETAGLLAAATSAVAMGPEIARQIVNDTIELGSEAGPLNAAYLAMVRQYADSLVAFMLLSMLVVRAAVVPSTWRRTLALAGAFGLLIMAMMRYDFESDGSRQVGAGIGLLALWILAAAVATVISYIIHDLREEVRHARRLGQYTLEEKLGEGGMGTVYRARHAMLRRPTAVKLLRPGKLDDRALARFEREVQLTASLSHPNTVTVFDYGRTPDGVFYYAMELVQGASLEQVVELSGPQPPARVVYILRSVCGALSEAHSLGLIHRDIKPANIMLANQGGMHDVAKVVDFGLVKELAVEDGGLSREDTLAGTPMYLAPETLRSPDRVDARTDLYALGCVAYFMLTGKPVFEGHTVVEICGHHLHSAPVSPSERLGSALPAGLERLVLQCLEKDPDRRPPGAADLEDALQRLDLPSWTAGEARIWWKTYGDALAEADDDELASSPKRLAVDMTRRL